MNAKAVVNPVDLPLKALSHGDKFAVQIGEVAEALGLSRLGCMLHVVPPGKIAFPFHRHHEADEMFFILSGTGEYRFGDQRFPVKTGDCLSAPAGGEAHQIINTGSEELRYLGFSNNVTAEIVEYPDSGKIGISAGIRNWDYAKATLKMRGRMTTADYWDGE
ncbi:MAG: cupin domain-containing protein [Alphaproteobacteria bacterium]|nr:cupin domain-containing protein [Alphaproteobacteria bacterium]MDE2110850.1 cupin domain-containing protein [Alphaproteobacteria bacterium]MDE2495476.1 cupin domain-containing protein [Alphaproteobacteria bacterium]